MNPPHPLIVTAFLVGIVLLKHYFIDKLLMKMRKRNGPKTETCDTPHAIVWEFEFILLIESY